MDQKKYQRFLYRGTSFLLLLALVYLALHYALPWTAPFFLALVLALILEPVVALLTRLGLPRWLASATATVALGVLFTLFLGVVAHRLWYECALLIDKIPSFLTYLPALLDSFLDWFNAAVLSMPVSIQEGLLRWLNTLPSETSGVATSLSAYLFTALYDLILALPKALFFVVTTLLATFFTSLGLRDWKGKMPSYIPSHRQEQCNAFLDNMRQTLGGWLRAQGTLMVITFFQLTVGFFLLGQELFLILAALVSLVDALPLFGTGSVLLPWALIALVQGDLSLTLGLLLLYGTVWLVRTVLEPKLLGAAVGLSPLTALVAMYVGGMAYGVLGIIFAPLVVMLCLQLRKNWDK